MKRQDIISIFITFAVGIFAGAYLYLTDFASVVSKVTVPDVEEAFEFSIVGDVYGGCREACPSFQVVNDGAYRYIYTPEAGQAQILRQGTLPTQLQRQLRTTLTKEELLKQSKTLTPALCNSYTDGIDVKYEVTIDGEVYIIDSCGTAVDGESQLWTTLGSVWDYYENLGNKQ